MRISPINNTLIYNNQRPTFKSNISGTSTKSYGLRELSADVMCFSFLASHLDFKEYVQSGATTLNKILRVFLCASALTYGLFELKNQLKIFFE